MSQSWCFAGPPASSLPAVSFLRGFWTVDGSAWLWDRAVCVHFHMFTLVLVIPRSSVEPARHSRLHTHSSFCFSQYCCSWYPALLIFCNLVLIFTLLFTIAFCQSILQKMCIRNVNVFFTFLFLFNTDIYCLFLLLEVLVVKLVNSAMNQMINTTKIQRRNAKC